MHYKNIIKRERKKQIFFLSEREHRQVLIVKRNMHLILHSNTTALQIVTISIWCFTTYNILFIS